jgi:dihydrolipoamide dehydrogenase
LHAVLGGAASTIELSREATAIFPLEEEQPMPTNDFDADVIVIGAGPGGYVAAIHAAQLGARVLCIEKEYLGGTCLNWGCIPSKALISTAERFVHVKEAKNLGVQVEGKVEVDFKGMVARVEKIVKTQRSGIGMLFQKNGVQQVEGFARFVDPHTVEVEKDGERKTFRGRNFILAAGSSAIRLPIPGLEGENVWTSDDAVFPPFLPKSMLIIGGGAVGVEFAYVFNSLGVKTTVVEMLPTLIPMFDEDLGVELGKQLKRQGVEVITGSTVEKAERTKEGWKCFLSGTAGGQVREAEVVLLGVGRKANTEGMNLEKVGVRLHPKGVEVINNRMQTSVPHIYAIGDMIGKVALAHVASAEGKVAAENCVKNNGKEMDYRAYPNVVFTVPEVASVGLTEAEARAEGREVLVGSFPFRPLGKAMAAGEQEGFVKVIADREYGELLGMHIIGPHASDLIHEGVVALKLEATLDYLVDTIHAHPTFSEAIIEAYEKAAHGKSIHTL